MKKTPIIRLVFVLLVFAVFNLIVVGRLFYWQVIRAQELKEIGQNQSADSIPVNAKRGDILSSDLFPLGTNTISYLLYSNPKLIKDKDEYAKKIADILNTDAATISAALSKDLFWVKIAQKVEPSKKNQIEALKLPGFGSTQESFRYYPEASMAAHLVGFVAKDNNGKNKGYFGLEGYYNEQLKGRDGKLYVIRDALGNEILNEIREEKKIDGRSLILNIDRTIQFAADKHLESGVKKYGAEGGSVIVMETKTGKVLAMSSFPRFDPQKYYDYDGSTYVNPVISSVYEPGSTFKVLVMSAAINAGAVKPDTKCTICAGPVQIGDYSVKTWNDKYFPDSTMTNVIQHSDNTGMVFVGKKLGLSKLISSLKAFGIGENTGVDLQGETSSEIRDEKQWYPIDLATASFGQGITLTPMQLVNGVNAIANGGKLMKPKVVSKIELEDGRTIEIKPEVKRQVISEATSKVMTEMMVNAVENGEAKWVKIKDYRIAGKTGTAQIPIAGHYDPHQTIASFVGFFPAKDPQITMLVLVNKPKTSIYGAETAAPIFFQIARDLITYFNIAPSL